MTISQAYSLYPITKTLKEHMIRAAAIGYIIAENSKKIQIDKELIVQTLLLHDTGNIIKFDLDAFPQLLGSQINEINYWKQEQKKFTDKYGNDEHSATEAIAREINVPESTLNLLKKMIYNELSDTANAHDWNVKICNYSDLRSGPFSVLTVDQRFDDLIERYKGRNHKISNIPKTQENRRFCLMIEKELQEIVDIPLESIHEETIKPLYKEIENYSISTFSS